MIAQKAVGQRLVFTQQAQQQVLRLYVRRAELAGLISREEDYAPCFLCIPLEHMPSPRCSLSPLPETSLSLPGTTLRPLREEALLSRRRLRHRGSTMPRRTNLPVCYLQQTQNLNLSLPQNANSTKRARPLPPGHDATAARGHNAGQTQGYGRSEERRVG